MAIRKQKGLGLGLEALLGPSVERSAAAGTATGAPHELPLESLRPGRYQPRSRIDDAGLEELAASIRARGVIQPVLVRAVARDPNDGAQRFEIIAGERRFRAAGLAGLDRVPVIVRDVGDEAAAAMALIENIQRRDLAPLEEARGLKRLTDEFGLTHEAAAAAVGRSRSAASNLLRLLQLSAPVQRLLEDGEIEMGHARALLPLPAAEQIAAAHRIVARKLNVREAEALAADATNGRGAAAGGVGSTANGRGSSRAAPALARDLARIEERLADALAAPVQIRVRSDAGKSTIRGAVHIGFASLDEMNGLLAKLGLEAE